MSASLLIGAGYDCYIVLGTADKKAALNIYIEETYKQASIEHGNREQREKCKADKPEVEKELHAENQGDEKLTEDEITRSDISEIQSYCHAWILLKKNSKVSLSISYTTNLSIS